MGSLACWTPLLLLLSLLLVVDVESRQWGMRRPRGNHMKHRHRHGNNRRQHDRGPSRWSSEFFRRLGFDFDFDFGWHGFGRQLQWWEGPNVCERDEESNQAESEGNLITHHHKMALQVCEESKMSYRCKTTVQSPEGLVSKMKLYECCHGYSREHGQFGCPERLRMDNLLVTAEDLGLSDFLKAVKTVRLDEKLARGNYTLFTPQDGAFPLPTGPGVVLQDQHRALMISRPMLDKMEDDLEAVLLGHFLQGPRRASSFADEEIVETASPNGSTIRINFYSRPEKLTTANCVKVTSTDNMATNGVIHTVESVLPTVSSSVLDIIQREEDFSLLKTALGRANLVPDFKGEGQYTLFAPTNAAFRNLEQRLLDRLLRGDHKCLEKVIKEHVLPHVICSNVIQGRAKSRNVLHNYVNLTRTEDNKVFVNDAQVVRADIMATNGVVHVIDAVLVPDDALDLVSVAEKKQLTELVGLVRKAGLIPKLQKTENVTLFAPLDVAIQNLPPRVNQKLNLGDQSSLQEVLRYHVATEGLTSRQLYNNRLLDTLDGDHKLRINEYSSFPFGKNHVMTVQCAPIVATNMDACNGIVHIIDQVLLPPNGNVVDVLAANPEYSTLVRLLKVAGLADSLQGEGPFTVFAPNNEAFKDLGKETLRDLERDPDELANVLQMHVYKENLCCAGIFHTPWWHRQRVRTLNGRSLFLTRDQQGRPAANNAVIGSCDVTAINGVVHGISMVLLPSPKPWYMFP